MKTITIESVENQFEETLECRIIYQKKISNY
jgi:hypothetical protein